MLTLRALFIAQSEGKLPSYLGSTLRGVLGHCLRDFTCTRPRLRCYLCEKKDDCAYAQCFSTPGNVAGAVNPFVLHALVQDKPEWKPGDICSFDLTLIGRITNQSGIFLDALQAMSERGWGASRLRFALEQVTDPWQGKLIFSAGKSWLRNLHPEPLQVKERPATAALVRFDTPVRILVQRNLCHTLPFEVLLQSMIRRVALLSHAYTGYVLQWDEERILAAAQEVKIRQEQWQRLDFQRYSMNQPEGKLSLPAIQGWALYEGDITPFTPWLTAGQRLHVGKNSTIGFGHFEVVYDR